MTEFTGFPSPTRNFFSLPNEMINIIAGIKSLSELKVILYVVRHTWGFQEYGVYKTISVDEFMHGRKQIDRETGKVKRMDNGTGLAQHSVIDALKAAEEHGYLICDTDDSDLARVKKSYALKMLDPSATSAPPAKVAPGAESTVPSATFAVGSASSAPGSATFADRSEKDTSRKTLEKDTEEKQEGTGAVAPPARTAISELKEKISDTAGRLKAIGKPAPSHVEDEWQASPLDEDVEATVRRHPPFARGGKDGQGDAAVSLARADAAARPAGGIVSAGAPGAGDTIPAVVLAPSSATTQRAAPDAPTAQINGAATAPRSSSAALAHGGGATHPPTGDSSPVASESRAPGATVHKTITVPTRPKMERPQLTLEGSQVKEHLELIQASTISHSHGNIRALNKLGKNPDVSFESLKATIEHLEALKFVIEHGIAIDVQMLANDESRLNFEKNWPVARKKKRAPGNSGTLADGKTSSMYAI